MRSIISLLLLSLLGSLNSFGRLNETSAKGIGELKMELATPKIVENVSLTSAMLGNISPLPSYRSRGTDLILGGVACVVASPIVCLVGIAITLSPGGRGELLGGAVLVTSTAMFTGGLTMIIVGIVKLNRGNGYSLIIPYSNSPNEVGIAYRF